MFTWGGLILSKQNSGSYNGFQLMAGLNKFMRDNGIGYWSYMNNYCVPNQRDSLDKKKKKGVSEFVLSTSVRYLV
jgi:hypothetical protein